MEKSVVEAVSSGFGFKCRSGVPALDRCALVALIGRNRQEYPPRGNWVTKKAVQDGRCSVCGLYSRLTFEHVPPAAAFNSDSMRQANMRHYFDTGLNGGELIHPDEIRHGTSRRGAGAFTLCQPCNNDTGGRYAKSYVDWSYQAMRFYLHGGSSLALPFRIFPGAVAKQLVCMFASACGPGMLDAQLSLRKFVLDTEARGFDPKIRILCAMLSQKSSKTRQAGITGMIDGIATSAARLHTFAEISFPPFAYIMTFDSEPPSPGLTDITFFAYEPWRRYREIHLPLPVKEVHSYFPGDYRTGDEWEATLKETRQKKLARKA